MSEARKRRRLALVFHLVAEAAAIVGCALRWSEGLADETVLTGVAGSETTPGRIVFLATLLAFFFTSYDLVANADYQLVPLLASAVAFGAAALALYTIYWNPDTLDQFVQFAVAVKRDAHSARLRVCPGLILSLVAAFDMLVASIYLTVFAARGNDA
jgi:hypothetical protein